MKAKFKVLSPEEVLKLMSATEQEDDDSWATQQNTDPGSNENKPQTVGKKRDRDDVTLASRGDGDPSIESVL